MADSQNNDADLGNNLLLQTENAHLQRKVETLQNLTSQYSTKYKEMEVELHTKYKQKEDEYAMEINKLLNEIESYKLQLSLLQSDSLNKRQSDKENILAMNHKHNQEIKSLKHKLMEQKNKTVMLEQEITDLKIINECQKKETHRHIDQIMSLQQLNLNALHPEQSAPLNATNLIPRIGGHASKTMSMIDMKQQRTATFTEDMKMTKIYNNMTQSLYMAQDVTMGSNEIHQGVLYEDNKNTKMELEIKYEIYKTDRGQLVLKQLPYSSNTHVWINVFIGTDQEKIIAYLNRKCYVQTLLDILISSDEIQKVSKSDGIQIYAGNEDGELDDTLALSEDMIISERMIMNIFVKYDDESGTGEDNPGGICCIVL